MVIFKDRPDFKPDYTPLQIFKLGVFGGTYFRPIYSSVVSRKINGPNKTIKDYLKSVNNDLIYSEKCEKSKNYYKEKAGQSLKIWESKGWITKEDPYGFIQWYINFFLGRRNKKIDDFQIKRFNSFKSRMLPLYKKYKTDKIAQSLLQWCIKI